MRVTNSKTIYLTNSEHKEAILDWIASRHNLEYHDLMMKNHFFLDVTSDGLSIIIDGEVEEFSSEVEVK